MPKKSSLQAMMTRRTLLVGTGQVLLGSALIGRMAYLQIWESEHYKYLAQGNRVKVVPIIPGRGLILDRTGVVLAENEKSFRALLESRSSKDLQGTLEKLKALIDLHDINLETKLRESQKSFRFLILKDGLSWDEVAQLEAHTVDFPGVSVTEGSTRTYPFAYEMAHLIGYIQPPSSKDKKGNPKFSKIEGWTVGKSGLEKTQNSALQGTPGYTENEVNSRGQVIRTLKKTPSHKGKSLELTIDCQLQGYVHERLAQERSASAVILNIHDGHVLALNSVPSFDPNLFVKGISHKNWQNLLQNPYHPLINKAIAGEYPPGSLFKLVVAIAALEDGLISAKQTYHCPGHFELHKQKFHCVRSFGHGRLNLITALAQSCDVYFYKLALKVGIERIAKTAKHLGLGMKTGIELPGEKPGLIPTKKWKRQRFGKDWFIGETIISSIGQGYVTATPLQMALMMARIANGGQPITPRLIRGPSLHFPPNAKHTRLLQPILEGTQLAVNSKIGTAYGSRIVDPTVAMGGKTSTSQVRRISLADRKSGKYRQEKPWKYRDHSLFVGYAPIHEPKYVVSVVVEHGGWGSKTAAPIARDILLAAQKMIK